MISDFDRSSVRMRIEVMQAYLDGKSIEILADGSWQNIVHPTWNWFNFDYRIKKEPREYTILLSKKSGLIVGGRQGEHPGPINHLYDYVKVREVVE